MKEHLNTTELPIKKFLNWIEATEIHQSQSQNSREQIAMGINGPYADIKELIGKISPQQVQFK